jgi:hypothetical protein
LRDTRAPETSVGDKNRDKRNTAWDLVGHLRKSAKYEMAEAVCLRLLELERKILGDQHESTFEAIGSLIQSLKKQENHAAIEYLDRTVFKSLPKFIILVVTKCCRLPQGWWEHVSKMGKAQRLRSSYDGC